VTVAFFELAARLFGGTLVLRRRDTVGLRVAADLIEGRRALDFERGDGFAGVGEQRLELGDVLGRLGGGEPGFEGLHVLMGD